MHRSIAVTILLGIATEADASDICGFEPFVETYDLPLGCPLVITQYESDPPDIYAVRNNTTVLLATTVLAASQVSIETRYEQLDCAGSVESTMLRPRPFTQFRLDVQGAQLGDPLLVSDLLGYAFTSAGTVMPPGTCTVGPPPNPVCQMRADDCTEPHDDTEPHHGGCSTSRGRELAVAVGLPLLMVRRRRCSGERKYIVPRR